MKHENRTEKHPSYGQARFSRVSGGAHLYGSDFHHQNFMMLEVFESDRIRSLSSDRYHSTKPILRAWMSESQFCELITRPNTEGIPVTLKYVDGTKIPDPPRPDMRKRFQDDFTEDAQACVRDLREATKALTEAIDTGKANKTTLREIARKLEHAACAIDRGIPWIKEQFEESMEKIIGRAKTEIEAHVAQVAMQLGTEQMRAKALESAPALQIEGGTE